MEKPIQTQIMDLLNTKGKSADAMTSALSRIGDGSMENGINRIAQFMENAGKRQGFKQGTIICGIVVAGSITLAWLAKILIKYIKKKIKQEKNFEVEGKAILKKLEEVSEDIE